MVKIYIEPQDVWDYAADNLEKLDEVMVCAAANDDTGVSIYVTVDEEDFPVLSVVRDSEEIYQEYFLNPQECERKSEEIYAKYLEEDLAGKVIADSFYEDDSEDFEEKQAERENEIDSALIEFIEAIHENGSFDLSETELEEIKDSFLEILAKDYGLNIYRPMTLVTDEGEEFTEDYPYEHMDFD